MVQDLFSSGSASDLMILGFKPLYSSSRTSEILGIGDNVKFVSTLTIQTYIYLPESENGRRRRAISDRC